MSGCLRIAFYVRETEVLGPHKRFALWVQGCEKNCAGCIAQSMKDPGGGETVEIPRLTDIILSVEGIEGITVSGGEPFLQARELCELIRAVRAERDFGVIVYTGYALSELSGVLLNEIDTLIDGEYRETLDDDKGYRGSSNQNIIHLTDRYKDCYDYGLGRKTEFFISGDKRMMVGIPSESAKKLWEKLQADDFEQQ
ncbi:MAG: radical SAM protein [Oscillospiraceae bacterium]|jgi:anaerobic ribonucleoside-triphosphate reductase activating protein|nr:radical SAM protein [Oscillospiraceae bacterium]